MRLLPILLLFSTTGYLHLLTGMWINDHETEGVVASEVESHSLEATRARALLRQTAETYRNLPASYFEAVSTTTLTTAKTEVRTVTHKKIFWAPPSKIRVELDGPRESTLLIADGVSLWIVYPKANEYEKQPQPEGWRGPLSRYVQLGGIRGDPSIVGFEEVQGARCSLVRIVSDHGETQQLWIDSTTHLVRRDTIDKGKSQEETAFTLARLGEPAPPDAFNYVPAATNAKNRRELGKTLIGTTAPDFSLRDLDGSTVDLRALRGQPVLLDFWATWCGDCRVALPFVELLRRGLKDRLTVFGIDNEEPQLAREYLQKYGYTLRSLVDRRDQAVNLYHVYGWPTTVLIDRDGKIVFYGYGFEPEKLRDALQGVGVW
jgi:cytochrome c biogenesis protein CcmG/thiol:disulfide interchange protein DsbE